MAAWQRLAGVQSFRRLEERIQNTYHIVIRSLQGILTAKFVELHGIAEFL